MEECDDNDYMETSSPTKSTPEVTPQRAGTGLAQSDQSLSEEKIAYGYTTQSDYGGGPRGYSEGPHHEEIGPCRVPSPASTKPKITSALYKKTFDFDPSSDGPLLSDVLANDRAEAGGNKREKLVAQKAVLDEIEGLANGLDVSA